MTPEKSRRMANATGFLSGIVASLHALRDASAFWPPAVLWGELRGPQRLELSAGLVLIFVFLVRSLLPRQEPS